jgi:hypothetical protein
VKIDFENMTPRDANALYREEREKEERIKRVVSYAITPPFPFAR